MSQIPKRLLLRSFKPLMFWQILLLLPYFDGTLAIHLAVAMIPTSIILALAIMSLFVATWFSYLHNSRNSGIKRDRHELINLKLTESKIANKASSEAILVRKKIRTIEKRMAERVRRISGIK